MKWLYIRAHGIRHATSMFSMRMYVEELLHPRDLLWTIKLRWFGGLRWGEIFWDERKSGETTGVSE